MEISDLTRYTERLFSAALAKCGDAYLASDLAQETLLAALAQLRRGGGIESPDAWLFSVLNRKWNDALRRKYKRPTISIGEVFDVPDERDVYEEIASSDEAERLRRGVAYLAGIHREVIVSRYLKGEKVDSIARRLGVPVGTVKSRLAAGRERLKKGFEKMDNYTRESYEPVTLQITASGNMGKNGEPYTLAEDLISQNLLWLAYEKPLTVEELSKAIGIPCAYVEPIVERLVNSEIMKRVGNSVYTDFMISTLEDQERHIPAQVQLAEAHFGAFWNPIQKGLDELRETAYYLRQSEWQRYSLEMYFVFSCLDYGIYRAFSELYDAKVNFPERPDGGSWIAFGNVHFEPFDYRKHMGIMMHSYAGWRWAALDDYLGAKHIELQIYDPEGFPIRTINTNPHWRRSFTEWDADYLRLLWVVHSETDVAATAFNTELLKSIPFLIRLKILREDENGKPRVNAPILSTDELRDMLHRISEDVKKEMIQNLKPVLTEYLKGKEHRLPPHLDSVPLQKRYSHATGALLFAVLRQALRRGKLYDNDFDDDSHDNQPPYPLVLAFE